MTQLQTARHLLSSKFSFYIFSHEPYNNHIQNTKTPPKSSGEKLLSEYAKVVGSTMSTPPPHDDLTVLITLWQEGDRSAFGKVFERFHNRLCSMIRSMLREHYGIFRDEVAEDLAMDTWLKADEKIHAYEHESQTGFLAWLRQIAENLVRNWARKKVNQESLTEPNDELLGVDRSRRTDGLDVRIEKEESRRLLMEKIQNLRKTYSIVLMLHLQDYSYVIVKKVKV